MIEAGRAPADAAARRNLYYEVQKYVVEDLMPWAFLFVVLNRGIWSMELSGILRNPMQKVCFASMNWQGMATTGVSDDAVSGDDTNGDDTGGTSTGDIPGYSFLGLLGAAALGLGLIGVKKLRT